ncbi:hypothetical protein VTN02DRAFT_1525 [Thermoascus thermophilus]
MARAEIHGGQRCGTGPQYEKDAGQIETTEIPGDSNGPSGDRLGGDARCAAALAVDGTSRTAEYSRDRNVLNAAEKTSSRAG